MNVQMQLSILWGWINLILLSVAQASTPENVHIIIHIGVKTELPKSENNDAMQCIPLHLCKV